MKVPMSLGMKDNCASKDVRYINLEYQNELRPFGHVPKRAS